MAGAELELGKGHGPDSKSESTVMVQQAEGSRLQVNINEGPTAAEIAERAVAVDNAALDSILSLNSFFCVAIFIGLGLPAQQGAAASAAPEPLEPVPCELKNPEATRQTVLMLEIIAFACVLSSTLCSAGLKLVLNMNANSNQPGVDQRNIGTPRKNPDDGSPSLTFFRSIMFLSAAALVTALVLLCISMVFYVELYAGRITCSARARKSTLPLIILTGVGLLFLLLVVVLFIKWFERTLRVCTNHIRKKLGLPTVQEKPDDKDVESLLPKPVV